MNTSTISSSISSKSSSSSGIRYSSPKRHFSPIKRVVHRDSQKEVLAPIKPLSKGTNPIYLAHNNQSVSYVILKFFPFQNEHPSPLYVNCLSALSLNHPNVIKVRTAQDRISGAMIEKNDYFSVMSYEFAPYGDFLSLLTSNKIPRDDKFIRTFFRQLIEGLEYLHSQGVAHLDLKLENLLLGKGYTLKIADLDGCYYEKNPCDSLYRRGTLNFRAPEIKEGKLINPKASDIYSAGIILFALKSGLLPYHEERKKLMYYHMLHDPSAFWEAHNESQDSILHCDEEFQDLFIAMVKADPQRRITIEGIKKSDWYQGPVYTSSEMKHSIKNKLKIPKLVAKSQL